MLIVPISTQEKFLTTELPSDAGISIRVQSAERISLLQNIALELQLVLKFWVRDKPPVIEVASKATGFAENDSEGVQYFTISATGNNFWENNRCKLQTLLK